MKNKTFLEITLSVPPSRQELLIPTLLELGSQGFLEEDSALKSYMDVTGWDDPKFEHLKHDLKSLLQTISSNIPISFRVFEEENWNEQWEKSLKPIEVGHKLVIKPSWSVYENKENRILIKIDPKMSFGTGYHETTRLTLILLEKYLKPGVNVLDVGTGTGILAIAAIKLGASRAVGIDIDEWSIENAQENVIANDVAGKVEIACTSLNVLAGNQFELITANLTLNTNIELLTGFSFLLKESGLLLLSGLLQHDREKMVETLVMYGFRILEEVSENEWIALAAKK